MPASPISLLFAPRGLASLILAASIAAIGGAWGYDNFDDFRVPDLRGVFLRGVNGGRADGFGDPDASSRPGAYPSSANGDNVGSYQYDALQDHVHSSAILTYGGSSVNQAVISLLANGTSQYLTTNTSGNPYNKVLGPVDDGVHGTLRISRETRPINANVNYIIKY